MSSSLSDADRTRAWNALVMDPDPTAFGRGDIRRDAAIGALYLGIASNGGLSHYLSSTANMAAQDTVESLKAIGATVAAHELGIVLDQLSQPIPAMTEDAREALILDLWTDEMEDQDMLSEAAEADLSNALDRHAIEHADFYLNRTT